MYNLYILKKNKKYFFIQTQLILLFVSFFISNIQSQKVETNPNEKFNNTLYNYNNTKLYLDDFKKKMKDITLNIFLRVRFRELKRIHKNIELKILEIQEQLSKENYDNKQIIDKINLLDEDIKKFEKKYNKANKVYYEFEKVKSGFSEFFKLFFIILFICVVIVFCIIGIASYYVMKNQRKYYKLKEEVSFNTYQREMNKVINNNNNRIKDKDILHTDKTTEESQSRNAVVNSTGEPNSHDEMKRNEDNK